MMNDDDYVLVYSTDGSHNNKCPKCKKINCSCPKQVEVIPSQLTVKIRLEKKARGGKSVTLLFNLPHNPEYFKDLCKKLKAHCGTGGSFKNDNIEIQGDQKNKIKLFLENIGFKVQFAGG